MSATPASLILQQVNATLAGNGLNWIGVPTGAANPMQSRDDVLSSIGKGPLARIHFKKFKGVGMTVSTIIPASVADGELSGRKMQDFDLFEYYKSLLDPETYVILSEANKAILRQINIRITPNTAITGSFTSEILEPSDTVEDLISEISSPEGLGDGTQLTTYTNVELPVVFGGQFFPGVTGVDVTASVDLSPIRCVGGIYGYIFGQPFQVDVSIETYEKHFSTYQEFFNDVDALKDMNVGPFTVPKLKMVGHSVAVDAGSYKKVNVQLKGKNLIFQS